MTPSSLSWVAEKKAMLPFGNVHPERVKQTEQVVQSMHKCVYLYFVLLTEM